MINLQDDRLRDLIKFFINKLPEAGQDFQDTVGKFYELVGDMKDGTQVKALLTKKFENKAWKPEISDDEMITLAKKINYGPLYYAIAGRLSPNKRNEAFPQLKDKFESITEAVSDDQLTDSLFESAKFLKAKIDIIISVEAQKIAKELGLSPNAMVSSDTNGNVEFGYALQLLVSQFLQNPRMVRDSFHLLGDSMGEAGGAAGAGMMGHGAGAGHSAGWQSGGTTTGNVGSFAVPIGTLAPSDTRGPSYDDSKKKKKKKKKARKKGKL
jgi:hypothetical protein